MLLSIGLIVALALVLALGITAWSIWLQGHLYTEVSEGLPWRGPLAGAAVLAPILIWMAAARASPGTYRPLWEFSSTETTRPLDKLYTRDDQGKLQEYRLIKGTRQEYRLGGDIRRPLLPTEPRSVLIEEGSELVEFFPERDGKGNLLRRKTQALNSAVSEPLRYVDSRGRVMLEGSLGQFTIYKGGALMVNLLLNLLLFAGCFLGLWLLARFQWPHALLQALALWVLLLLTVLPLVLAVAEARSGT
jgi:hypothetical protein